MAEEEKTKIHDFPGTQEKAIKKDTAQRILSLTGKDMGKTALILSLFTLLMLIVLFFGLRQNMAGLSEQLADYEQYDLGSLSSKVAEIETQMQALQNLPAQTRAVILNSYLEEMQQQLSYLEGVFAAGLDSQKLREARQILVQIQSGLQK